MNNILRPLRQHRDTFKSARLKKLVTYTHEGGLVPDMEQSIEELDYLVEWHQISGIANTPGGTDNIPLPRKGVDENFDEANEVVN